MKHIERKERERSRRDSESVSGSPLLRMLRGSLLGMLTAVIVSLLLSLLLTWFLFMRDDPEQLRLPFSVLLLLIGSLTVGITTIRYADTAPLPTAMLACTTWVAVTALFSLLVPSGIGSLPAVYAIALKIPQALFVIFGVLIGKSRPRRVSPRRRH